MNVRMMTFLNLSHLSLVPMQTTLAVEDLGAHAPPFQNNCKQLKTLNNIK